MPSSEEQADEASELKDEEISKESSEGDKGSEAVALASDIKEEEIIEVLD